MKQEDIASAKHQALSGFRLHYLNQLSARSTTCKKTCLSMTALVMDELKIAPPVFKMLVEKYVKTFAETLATKISLKLFNETPG